MTMGVIAVALALPLFLNLFLSNVRSATGNWNDAFDLSVYMDKKASAGADRIARQAAAPARRRGWRYVSSPPTRPWRSFETTPGSARRSMR